MGIHFYDTSPSDPWEQLGRLGPARALLNAGIPCVVWAEDALSIVHRVPTVLFDLQLLVPEDSVHSAAEKICAQLPYSVADGTHDYKWKDYGIFNPERPPAFNFGKSTLLLKHTDLESCPENEPDRILVHAGSTFHFDVTNSARSILNPSPPDDASSNIRFPTLAAFFDALVDTHFEPPLPFIHKLFSNHIRTYMSYLKTYTVGEQGILYHEDPETHERLMVPACSDVVQNVKEENRPFLIRAFLFTRALALQDAAIERWDLKRARLAKIGIQYDPSPLPYNPLFRARHIPNFPSQPCLTPFLVRGPGDKLSVDWRPLARYASIAHKLCR